MTAESLQKGKEVRAAYTNGTSRPSYKERMDNDIMRVKLSLVNLMQRRYPDNWREKLAEFVQ